MTAQLPLDFSAALRARDEAMARVETCAGEKFTDRAAAFVLEYLRTHGPQSGERLTDECWVAGIRAHDARAMGPVFMRLLRRGHIEKCGQVARRRGHGCSGGNVYRLVRP